MARDVKGVPVGPARVAWLALWALLAWAGPAGAGEIVVVAHPAQPVDALTAEEIKDIYVGEQTFVEQVKVQPVDYVGRGPLAEDFLGAVVGMTAGRFRAYWVKQVFHGGRVPPRMVDGTEEALRVVAAEPGAIGYVPAEALKGVTSVKRVHTLRVP